ncbi:MAG: hypothetical protein LQ340_005005 [Diploschistes diacapsis]|nr:MAG: hypothetical protein LQ340_005005 [Diploschistes diacapsis]
MASEPTVEDLTTFMDFTAADRQLAVKFLKNDWDERQFHGDRMYGPENNPTTCKFFSGRGSIWVQKISATAADG